MLPRPLLLVLIALPLTFGSALAQQVDAAVDAPVFTAPVHDVPAPPFDQEHLDLRLRLDPDRGRVTGRATLTLRLLADSVATLDLFADDLRLDAVAALLDSATTVPLTFDRRDDTLRIVLDTLGAGRGPLRIEMTYDATPAYGLYRAEDASGEAVLWTEPLPEAQRAWVPLFDHPSDPLTADLHLTAPAAYHIAATGLPADTLVGEAGRRTIHFVQAQPVSPTALGFAATPYAPTPDTLSLRSGPLPTAAYVPSPDRLPRSLAPLASVLNALADRTGHVPPIEAFHLLTIPAPAVGAASWPGVAVFDDGLLLDQRAARDTSTADALAEAAARQWVHGLLAVDLWADRWMLDALAAYLSDVAATDDTTALAFRLEERARRYLAEASAYQRPLVWDRWHHPVDLMDRHSEDRGAWVLHHLRHTLGEEAFWGGLRRFVRRHARGTVETGDLQQAFADAAGRSVDDLFDTWVYAAGHPILGARYTYDATQETLTLTVEQFQDAPLVPSVFELPLTVEVGTLAGPERHVVELTDRTATVRLPLTLPPRYVLLDPDATHLMEVRMEQPASAWVSQLRYATHPVRRREAAEALRAYRTDPALLIGLRNALRVESEPRVRAAIAATVAALPPSAVASQVLQSLATDDPAPAVRAATLRGLTPYATEPAVTALLREAANREPSYAAQAAAVSALLRGGASGASELLRAALITPSYLQQVQRAALEALPAIDLPLNERLSLALEATQTDRPARMRAAAISVLPRLAPDHRRVTARLAALLDDSDRYVRGAAIRALGTLGSEAAEEALRSRLEQESEPSLRRLLTDLVGPSAAD